MYDSRGNCYASIGEYQNALSDFIRSAEVFRKISNANGYVYAASNAALTYAQLGDDDRAIKVYDFYQYNALSTDQLYYSRHLCLPGPHACD